LQTSICPAIGLHFFAFADAVAPLSDNSFDAFQSEIESLTEVVHCDVIALLTLMVTFEPLPAQ